MSEPQLVPLNAIFATDFVQILVPVTTANTMAEVAAAVAYHVEGKRVRALPYDKVVIYHGERLPFIDPLESPGNGAAGGNPLGDCLGTQPVAESNCARRQNVIDVGSADQPRFDLEVLFAGLNLEAQAIET